MNVHDLRFEGSNLAHIDESQAAELDRVTIKRGDILLNITGASVARCCIAPEQVVGGRVNQHVMLLRVDPDKTDSGWLGRALSGPYKSSLLAIASSGATREALTKADVSSFCVSFPPIEFQQRTVALLQPFDDLIENNRRRIEILEGMARLLFREWFVYFRYPGHEGVELVDSDLGPIPGDWDVRSFSELADFVNGFAFKPNHWLDEGLPIVKIKELKGGVTAQTPRYHGADIKKKFFIDDGAVLFSWSADLKAYVWASGPALLNQHLFVVQPHEVSDLFMFHSLNSRMSDFQARAQGTTMKHIKRSALREVKLAIPPIKLRTEFESVARPMLDLQLNLARQTQTLREARDLLLPRLVSGELDVSELGLGLVGV
ncbi:MAG: restriction endonuclease subunit S [Acidimicrobiia bacterium]|nr:restriction endonuclease subunit S [Acidimicrobiia bacterium]